MTAADISVPSDVEILNPDMYICNLEQGAVLDMSIYIDTGRGYVPADRNKDAKAPIGYIPVDSIYTPVEKQTTLSRAPVSSRASTLTN